MSAPRRALVVIDAQQEYFTGLLPIQYPPRDESIQRIGEAIDAAEKAGVPVVMVQHSAGDGAPVFDPTTTEYRLHASLETRTQDAWKRVVKEYASIFPGTGLADWLRENAIDTVSLTGYMTNNCVLSSAAHAESEGFTAEVLSDATGAIDIANEAGSVDAESVHTTLMTLLNSNFAAVATTEAWVRAVDAGAALDKSNLVESAMRGAAARA